MNLSRAINKPLIKKTTKGKLNNEMLDLIEAIKQSLSDNEMIVTGAVLSSYQRDKVLAIAELLGIKALNPLWHTDQERMLHYLANHYRFMIVKTSSDMHEFIGKIIDKNNIHEFLEHIKKKKISPIGEGGEYESLLLCAPFFKKCIEVKTSIHCDNDQCHALITNAMLKDKA